MTHKPTSASVTDKLCTCGYLSQSADDPDNPIIFDKATGEYQFTYQEAVLEGRSTLIIYHCPFCGGCAPPSKRDLLFAVIPRSEEKRLLELLTPIKTLQDARTILGNPDCEDFMTIRGSEKDETGPSVEHQREAHYEGLSKVADVWIRERSDGKVYWIIQGKYLGGSRRKPDTSSHA
jgi:hypothetical protein